MARSDSWRINKSGIMAVEGAQITKALQKVAGVAGLPGEFKVRFRPKGRDGGAIDFGNHEVFVGAGSLFTEAPMGGDKFDALVGLTLHEVGHQRIMTKLVEEATRASTMVEKEAYLFHKFMNIGEDIAIERWIRDRGLMEYYQAAHKWAMSGERHVDLNKLLEVWIEVSLGYKADLMVQVPQRLEAPLGQLMALAQWLRSDVRLWTERVGTYESYWKEIRDVVLNPPEPPKPSEPKKKEGDKEDNGNETGTSSGSQKQPPENSKPSKQDTDSKDKDDGTPQGKDPQDERGAKSSAPTDNGEKELESPYDASEDDGMDESLLEDIEDAIESNSEDITELVKKEMERECWVGHDGTNESVVRSRECTSPIVVPEFHLTKRLERILSIKKRLQTRTMRGEKCGKIDARRLHRVVTDQRVFSQRYKFPDGFPKTTILLDLSGSMTYKQVEEVLEASASLQVLVKAEVWGYDWNANQTTLKRIDDGKAVHLVGAGGGTPSGDAIVGVSLGLKRGGLVIHLTDGNANCGAVSPTEAAIRLSKRGVRLVNIIWGEGNYAPKYASGMEVKHISGLAEFPDALYEILVEESKLHLTERTSV